MTKFKSEEARAQVLAEMREALQALQQAAAKAKPGETVLAWDNGLGVLVVSRIGDTGTIQPVRLDRATIFRKGERFARVTNGHGEEATHRSRRAILIHEVGRIADLIRTLESLPPTKEA